MIVKFIDVGRNNVSWESECAANCVEELQFGWLYSQVKRNARVMSSEIDFLLKDDMKSGIITAGFHTIGIFEIV